MGHLINVTGRELDTDMSCSSTREVFKIDTDFDKYFYIEDNELKIEERIKGIEEFILKYPSAIKGFIVTNNELGKRVFDTFVDKFPIVKSVKRQGSKLHWYWERLTKENSLNYFK